MMQLCKDQLEKSCFLLIFGKNIPVYFSKEWLPPTNMCSGASVSYSYSELPWTHWTSPVLLSLWPFLKLFPLAEILFSLYLLIEVIFIFLRPTSNFSPSGKFSPVHSVKISLSTLCFPKTLDILHLSQWILQLYRVLHLLCKCLSIK